jgi:hypothetical protein
MLRHRGREVVLLLTSHHAKEASFFLCILASASDLVESLLCDRPLTSSSS